MAASFCKPSSSPPSHALAQNQKGRWRRNMCDDHLEKRGHPSILCLRGDGKPSAPHIHQEEGGASRACHTRARTRKNTKKQTGRRSRLSLSPLTKKNPLRSQMIHSDEIGATRPTRGQKVRHARVVFFGKGEQVVQNTPRAHTHVRPRPTSRPRPSPSDNRSGKASSVFVAVDVSRARPAAEQSTGCPPRPSGKMFVRMRRRLPAPQSTPPPQLPPSQARPLCHPSIRRVGLKIRGADCYHRRAAVRRRWGC